MLTGTYSGKKEFVNLQLVQSHSDTALQDKLINLGIFNSQVSLLMMKLSRPRVSKAPNPDAAVFHCRDDVFMLVCTALVMPYMVLCVLPKLFYLSFKISHKTFLVELWSVSLLFGKR